MSANDPKRTFRGPFPSVGLRRYYGHPKLGKEMRRREFITLLGGAAMWPLTARAQQGERVRRVGVLTGTRPEDAQNKDRNAAFDQALQQLGWTPGRNVRIDYRFSGGDPVTSRKQAEELVALAPDVISSTGSFSTGDTDRAGRVYDRPRSSRLRVRRQSVGARSQCYRLHAVRIWLQWKMA